MVKSIIGTFHSQIYCALCAKHADKVKADWRIKGKVSKDIESYIKGTSSVSKFNVNRHLEGICHRIALEMEKLCGRSDAEKRNPSMQSQPAAKQLRIDSTMHAGAKAAYKKMFQTAYLGACNGLPLNQFKTTVSILRANGVQLLSGCDDGNAARKFVTEIASTMRLKLHSILGSCFFSVLTDGSQPRKTGQEKELVMARAVVQGSPHYLVVGLIDMDAYGNANANNLKGKAL